MKIYFLNHFLRRNPLRFVVFLVVGTAALSAISESDGQSGINDALSKSASVKRDPFWPVGYVPAAIQQKAEATNTLSQTEASTNGNWSEAMKQVVINGVSSRGDNESVAVINGQVKQTADLVSITYGNATYTWAVESITPPSSVKLRRVSAQ